MPLFFRRLVAAFTLLAVAAACTYNEELGRSQLLFAGEGEMAQAAASSWRQLKQQQPLSRDTRYTSRLNRVAPKLLRAAGENPAEWEYLVFDDDSLNAFALPGGRIGIYTGIMDLMENDDQLATVVGHEIAHVKYRHSGERYSQNMVASVGLGVASIAVGTGCEGTARERRQCEERNAALVQALGMGAVYGAILPYSRKHELEADVGGVRYMTRAGYDPCEAIAFWSRMARASAGQARAPEFASTHPASATRIRELREAIAATGRRCR